MFLKISSAMGSRGINGFGQRLPVYDNAGRMHLNRCKVRFSRISSPRRPSKWWGGTLDYDCSRGAVVLETRMGNKEGQRVPENPAPF